MRYDLTEIAGQWIVRCDGAELGRFDDQTVALEDIALRLEASQPRLASLAVHFERPNAC